ncbi:DUF502 domain-containing protein [Candidatus Bipolaricaulota bacterium]|nr:DUF502 domain-containing protein [Candidatus Bipolaricaulota bacterium]
MNISRIFGKFKDIIVDGLVVIMPVTITGYLLWLGYNLIDSFFGRNTVLGAQLSDSLERLFGIEWIPGLSIIYTAVVVILLGLASRVYLGKLVQRYVNIVLKKLPLIKRIYPPAQEISEAILGESSFSSFKEVVLVEYPRPDSYSLGFVTNHIGDKVAVYIFPAPNPFTGRILFFPEEDVTYIDMPVEAGIKLVISMGISTPESLYEDGEAGKLDFEVPDEVGGKQDELRED